MKKKFAAMSRRLEKVNKHLQRICAEVFLTEATIPSEVLVTVSRVNATPNLRSADVWLYVLPLERGPAILKALQAQLYDLQGAVNRKLDMHPLPRLILRLDHGAAHAEKIEQRLHELEDNTHDLAPE